MRTPAQEVEYAFRSSMLAAGRILRKSLPKADIQWHVDFYDTASGEGYDVKSAKAISRSDVAQTELILLEWTNVRGDAGWLHGKADWIAFDTGEGFLIASRTELISLAERVDWMQPNNPKKGLPYSRYDRSAFGRKDAFCWVPLADVLSLTSTTRLAYV